MLADGRNVRKLSAQGIHVQHQVNIHGCERLAGSDIDFSAPWEGQGGLVLSIGSSGCIIPILEEQSSLKILHKIGAILSSEQTFS